MPTFFGRRYYRPSGYIGRTEKAAGLIILALLAVITIGFARQFKAGQKPLFDVDPSVYAATDESGAGSGAGEIVRGPSPFPDPGVADWQAPREVSRYTPENLYVKINGRADLYLQFQVVSLTFGSYQHNADAERTIDVYWYDMGEPPNALGIYQTEAPPEAHTVPLGRAGYQAGGAVFFHKGPSYVQVLPTSFTEDDGLAALEIARQIDGRITDTAGEDWADQVLPQANRAAESLAYIPQDAFSLSFLDDVYTAEYEIDGQRLTLFVHRAADEPTAAAVLDQYRGFFEDYGKVIWEEEDATRRLIAGDVTGIIDVVFVKGRYVGGVTGADQLEPARGTTVEFYNAITGP
jgi:hypothetical protein